MNKKALKILFSISMIITMFGFLFLILFKVGAFSYVPKKENLMGY